MMALTTETLVHYVLLELNREPGFSEFVTEKLALIRRRIPLPEGLQDALAVELAPGAPIAKLLMESWDGQQTEPQFFRLRALGLA
jgi:hypothetical protein